jgi:hypothetical protein
MVENSVFTSQLPPPRPNQYLNFSTPPQTSLPTQKMSTITAEIVLSKITDIEHAVRSGLSAGNIKAVMKNLKGDLVSDQHEY